MGRYLDIARRFEAQQRGKVSHPPQQVTVKPVTAKASPTIYEELCKAMPRADVLEVYPHWQGILVKSVLLDMSVWIVRNHADGIALAKETGFPSLTLDDVVKMQGRTADEARVAILPALITATTQ